MSDHVREAGRLLDHVADASMLDVTAANVLAVAQVHATLALVEQQRITNLLDLARQGADRDMAVALDDIQIGAAGEVWEGLGLS